MSAEDRGYQVCATIVIFPQETLDRIDLHTGVYQLKQRDDAAGNPYIQSITSLPGNIHVIVTMLPGQAELAEAANVLEVDTTFKPVNGTTNKMEAVDV